MDGIDWMDDIDDLDDADFLPSPSMALAKRLSRTIGRGSSRKVVPSGARPGAAMPPQMRGELSKIYETMKRLEEKQESQTKQLALLQSRSAGLQSADLFGLSLSNAIANAAGPAANKDWFGALAQVAPLLQNGQGAAASFKAKPISTLAFPAGALGLHLARQPRKVEFIINDNRRAKPAAAAPVDVVLFSPDGGTIRYEVGAAKTDVTRSSKEYVPGTPIEIPAAGARWVSAKAFFLLRGSEQSDLEVGA